MKKATQLGATLAIALVSLAISAFGQATATVVTNSGTIDTFSPDTFTVSTTGTTSPIAYHYTKSTTYVDETGAPVSMEVVKSGVPVTVYYTQTGDDLVASKVIVQRTTTTAPAAIQETTTTTTRKVEDD